MLTTPERRLPVAPLDAGEVRDLPHLHTAAASTPATGRGRGRGRGRGPARFQLKGRARTPPQSSHVLAHFRPSQRPRRACFRKVRAPPRRAEQPQGNKTRPGEIIRVPALTRQRSTPRNQPRLAPQLGVTGTPSTKDIVDVDAINVREALQHRAKLSFDRNSASEVELEIARDGAEGPKSWAGPQQLSCMQLDLQSLAVGRRDCGL